MEANDLERAVSLPLDGSNVVETVRYDAETERVYVNKTQYLTDVPAAVWEFHIGGYQVCEKWLKDRKGRTLGFDDVQHYGTIVAALGETMQIMAAIDEEIEMAGGFPLV
jgi:hypothetical protein